MAYSHSKLNFEKMLMKFMTEEGPLLEMLKLLCEKLIDAEVASKINADKSERTENRSGYRSGCRVRRFDTQMATIYLFVPKLRKGGYIPFFISAKKRSEAALMSVIQEAYINGVSTRKIEKLASSLGIDSISRSQVSQITKELNTQVKAFRERPLQETYPVLWVDALYEKIRFNGQVRNMTVLVVIGFDQEGKRDILAVEPVQEESEATYKSLFANLKERGLKNTWLVVSDAHKGPMKAIESSFIGCSWQRFMRNIMAHIPAKTKAIFGEKLKQIWLQPDIESSKEYANMLMDKHEDKYPGAIKVLEEGLEDSLQYHNFPRIDHRKISSTNMLERLNKEIRRRTRVVGIFPNMDSYIRLMTINLMEYSEDWSAGRCYINQEVISLTREDREKAA